jgi:hypothetical protein
MKTEFKPAKLFDLDSVKAAQILKSESAFTNDTGHIKSFGDEKTSSFAVAS